MQQQQQQQQQLNIYIWPIDLSLVKYGHTKELLVCNILHPEI